MSDVKHIEDLRDLKKMADIEEQMVIEKMIKSTDPESIIKAQTYLEERMKGQYEDAKSYFVDLYSLSTSGGYLDKAMGIAPSYLRAMARTPIMRSVINTRIEQLLKFSNPVTDANQAGWMIRKKKKLFDAHKEPTNDEKRRIEELTDYVLRCGFTTTWTTDDFDDFFRKTMKDSLEIDSMTYEVVNDRRMRPKQFVATDGATYRWLDQASLPEGYKEIEGYKPVVGQIYDNRLTAVFYPWELCLGIRNQSTDIRLANYGTPELEDLMKIVTWMLFGDEYNGRFFSQGSAPKGIIKLSGGVNATKLNDFRQQWQTMMSGVTNAWKTPVLEAEKAEFIDLQKSNRDMEFKEWNLYLIAVACAVYKMAPEEVGFGARGGQKGIFGDSSAKERMDYSREKGLIPLLQFFQQRFSKWVVQRVDPAYEFVFAGMVSEDDEKKADIFTKKLQYTPLNVLLKEAGLDPIEGADEVILNSTFMQWLSQKMMMNQQSTEVANQDAGWQDPEQQNPVDETQKSFDDNPIMKALQDSFKKGKLFETLNQ